jgi:ribosomal subunit interface protein
LKIQIRGRNLTVSDELREHAERRLVLALGRFGDNIGRVIVRFSKDGTGEIHLCEIDVRLTPAEVNASVSDKDAFAAIDHASDRISRAIGRSLGG